MVLVSGAVDGASHRRRGTRAVRPAPVRVTRVAPEVMTVARRVRRMGERLVLVSEHEVWLVPSE